jgi:hypothetical protein
MVKKSGSYRQIVSIPDDLKKRMDKVADQVNWSAVAASAFEKKLGEIAESKETKDMNDVIQRLRKSKIESEGETFKEGRDAGKSWVENNAEVPELKRLDRYHAENHRDAWYLCTVESDAFSAAEHLARAITGDNDLDRSGMREFWQGVLGDDEEKIHDDDFLKGFVDGAMELWSEVEGKL